MLNVPHGMGYPARMPVVPNRNEFFALQKTRSQKCTRMYIFDEVVAVGFNTLYYDASVGVVDFAFTAESQQQPDFPLLQMG